jgi:hypothetical protein
MTSYTVCLPHKRNPGNDKALAIALSCLMDNSTYDFKLIVDAACDMPLYPRVNAMVEQATTDCCVYLASDMFVAPGWDAPMLGAWNQLTFVTGIVVEPGAISMSGQNLHKDFGRRPDTFRRAEFEQWATSEAPMLEGPGWYCPYMFNRQRFLELGGLIPFDFEDPQHFTNADELLFKRHVETGGTIKRVKSFAYHLQRWSEPEEQNHPKRDM